MEYKVIGLHELGNFKEWEANLNKLGAEGWRLIMRLEAGLIFERAKALTFSVFREAPEKVEEAFENIRFTPPIAYEHDPD